MGEAGFGQCDRCTGLLTLFDTGAREEGVVKKGDKVLHVHRGCAFETETFIPVREWLDEVVGG